jgi:hypothetical protein
MRPDAFDLYVDATARVTMTGDAPVEADDLAARLRDGFGVVAVERCELAQ